MKLYERLQANNQTLERFLENLKRIERIVAQINTPTVVSELTYRRSPSRRTNPDGCQKD